MDIKNTKTIKRDKKPAKTKKEQSEALNIKLFPIIGIGASAGGLEALELFFKEIPAKTGMAYVVVTHLDRDHISCMAELITKYTPMPVITIEDGVRVKINNIYVIPPRKNVVLKNGALYLSEQNEPHFSNLPINEFLSSLAIERQTAAASIVLSGTGCDGTLGSRDIKLNGGLVLAQEPATTKYDSMPVSAINTGIVDFIIPPSQMPLLLYKWLRDEVIKTDIVPSDMSRIFCLIRAKTGYDFSLYKMTTIQRRIEKQMLHHNLSTLPEYVSLLEKDPSAVNNLFKDFLIGVTRFFRDLETFETFSLSILPRIMANKPNNTDFRAWVPGCSTGEEVYTIAIIIAEYMEKHSCHYTVQIFGTDIDNNALTVARTGLYADHIKHDVSPERLKKYFTKEKGKYRINKEIRRMVMFGEQNIIKDPPFTRVDIISCRNLMIYLNIKLQRKIIPTFYYSLNMPGALILGSSESIGTNTDLFEPFVKGIKIFANKYQPNARKRILNLPSLPYYDIFGEQVIKEKLKTKENSETNDAIKKLLLEQYMVPCLVVNASGDILHMYGSSHKFIKTSPMPETFNISNIERTDIRKLLKSMLVSAINKKTEVSYFDLAPNEQNSENDDLRHLDITIKPITNIDSLKGNYLIMFHESYAHGARNENADHSQKHVDKETRLEKKLQRDLVQTKENLQATIEELESSNEELQSLNEELQSTNEEMETSKEELYSLNEELMVTNTELQVRIDQLATVHDDMNNLFNSTEIATFFLDNNLCIKRFTPKAQEYFHIIPTDIGRSITHFTNTLKYEGLVDDAKEVLRTLNQKIISVEGTSGKWFQIKILPYRTVSNMIDGVIVTLNDISQHKKAETKLNLLNDTVTAALAMSKQIIDTVMIPLLVITMKMKVTTANRAFYKTFEILPEDVIDKNLFSIPGWDIPVLRELLENDIPDDKLFEGFEFDAKLGKNKNIKLTVNIRKINGIDNGDPVILLAISPTC